MSRGQTLHLHEEIMLLSLRDEQGTMEFGASWHLAVGGAVVAQLMMDGHLAAVDDGKKTFLEVANARPPEDELLSECLERVRTSRRRETVQTWVSRFAHAKRLKHRVAGGLCRKGILKEDEDKVLLLFRRRIYPERDPKPEKELRERMRKAIFRNGAEVDPRTTVVIALHKFEPDESMGCEAGEVGTSVFVFYSDYAPYPVDEHNLALVEKYATYSCMGTLVGEFPALPCAPVGNEDGSWGSVKARFGD